VEASDAVGGMTDLDCDDADSETGVRYADVLRRLRRIVLYKNKHDDGTSLQRLQPWTRRLGGEEVRNGDIEYCRNRIALRRASIL
jgi:hypothetical protein